MKSNIKQLITEYHKLKDKRQELEKNWSECFKYTLPIEVKDQKEIFDSTGLDAVEQLVASIFSVVTPASTPWFSLSTSTDLENKLYPEEFNLVKEQVKDADNLINSNLDMSNFSTEIHQCYNDLVVSGTACMLMKNAPLESDSIFEFKAVSIASLVISEDNNVMFFKISMLAREFLNKFRSRIDNPRLIQVLEENSTYKVKILHIIEKQTVGFSSKKVFLDKSILGEDITNHNTLECGSFKTNPLLIFRWNQLIDGIYGYSPVMKALPDIKTLNKVMELVLKNASIAVSGMWQVEDDGVMNISNLKLAPGVVIPKAIGSQGLTPLRVPSDFNVSDKLLNDLRRRIRSSLFTDKLSSINTSSMTATEIIERQAVLMRVLGATYGRIQEELMKPLLVRSIDILISRGLINPVLYDNSLFKMSYLSPVAQLHQNEKTNKLFGFIEVANSMGCNDILEHKEILIWVAKTLNIPASLIKDSIDKEETAI
ncbi:MAG: head-tail connector protein [Alphaproteobacteria bacterium]|nr:head-tail connector protein [Alphaproteobacteria bacterium]MBL0718134.1 head-tail connector protein [Alphaproteobacteria bacterium]